MAASYTLSPWYTTPGDTTDVTTDRLDDLLRHHRSLRYHRFRILEGIRAVAFRNLDELHSAMGHVGVDQFQSEQDIRAVQSHILESLGIEADPFNRAVLSWTLWLPWEVYLCLIYAEIEGYCQMSCEAPALACPRLTSFLKQHRSSVAGLKVLRDKTLHPQKDLELSDAQAGFFVPAKRTAGHYYEFIFQLQEHADAYIAWQRDELRSLVGDELDSMLPISGSEPAAAQRAATRLGKLKRLAAPLIPPLPELSAPLTNKVLTSAHLLLWQHIALGSLQVADCRTFAPEFFRRGASGLIRNIYQSFTLTIEVTVTASSIPQLTSSIEASAISNNVEAHTRENQKLESWGACGRVGVSLLHEPIQVFRDATNRSNGRRDRELEDLLPPTPTLKAMRAFRNSVFHLPRTNTDPNESDSRYWKRLRDDAVDWPNLCRQLLKYIHERTEAA